jgi:hypothetical protein
MSFNNLIALAQSKGKLPDISRRYLLSKLFIAGVNYASDKDKAKLASNLANIATKTASLVATKTDPEKWERAKEQAKAKMGGKHSARAMQLATKIYKDNGGGYSGKEPSAKNNSMKRSQRNQMDPHHDIYPKRNGIACQSVTKLLLIVKNLMQIPNMLII